MAALVTKSACLAHCLRAVPGCSKGLARNVSEAIKATAEFTQRGKREQGDEQRSRVDTHEEVANLKALVRSLGPEERDRLRNACIFLDDINYDPTDGSLKERLRAEEVSWEQSKQLFIFNAISLVGFGFLDNAIMIVAGQYIELKVGVILAISTMAAAGLGHIVADVAGIGLTHYVELFASKTGVRHPVLTPQQMNSKCARRMVNLGRASGLVVGCVIGMLPLLFYHSKKKSQKLSL